MRKKTPAQLHKIERLYSEYMSIIYRWIKNREQPIPHKGEMLKRIFARMDQLDLHNKMTQLFIKNGMEFRDLTLLQTISFKDYQQWQRWHRRSNRLMAFSTYTVLER